MVARRSCRAKVLLLLIPGALLLGWLLPNLATGLTRSPSRAQAADPTIGISGPNGQSVQRFELLEFRLSVAAPTVTNPFTQVAVRGTFTPSQGIPVSVGGFADAPDGSLFRLRFTPTQTGPYSYKITYQDPEITQQFSGAFDVVPSDRRGFIRPDPDHPYSFRFDNDEHFFPAGLQAWTLGKKAQPWTFIDQAASLHHNVLKVWLAAAPAADDAPPCTGCTDWPDGYITWPFGGTYHQPDYARFDLTFWQQLDAAIRYAAGQDIYVEIVLLDYAWFPFQVPDEDVQRFVDYALARYAANPNVFLWEAMNEWDRIEKTYDGLSIAGWVRYLGMYLHDHDPYAHPVTATGSCNAASFPTDSWTGVVAIHGCSHDYHTFALENRAYEKPVYMDEAAQEKKPAAERRIDWWAVAMAGGYVNFRSWIADLAELGTVPGQHFWPFFTRFWEQVPFWALSPHDELIANLPGDDSAYVMADPGSTYVVYVVGSTGGPLTLPLPAGDFGFEWYDPKQGAVIWGPATVHSLGGGVTLGMPAFEEDVVLRVWRDVPPTATPTPSSTPTPTVSPTATPTPTPTATLTTVRWSGDAAIEDSWLASDMPDTNFGSATLAWLRPQAADNLIYRAVGLSALPPGTDVVTATLCLHASGNGAPEPLAAYPLSRSWSEMTATFDSPWSQPGLAPIEDYVDAPIAGVHRETADQVCFDVTWLMQTWLAGYPNDGVLVRPAGEIAESLAVGMSEGLPDRSPHLTATYRPGEILPCARLDANEDGQVDIFDLQEVASWWGARDGDGDYAPRLDIDEDGEIDVADVMLVARRWGESCG